MANFLTSLCILGAAVSFAAWAVAVAKLKMENGKWKMRAERIPQFSILHSKFSIHTAVFVFFTMIATLCAQKQGGTNAPPNGASPPQMMGLLPQSPALLNLPVNGGAVSVTSNDVARGFLLESVTTNDTYSYAMSTNGTRYGRWWKRGAYDDVFRLDLGGMKFPLGTNLCSSLWVYTWGMAGARLGDATNRIAATGVSMSAVPLASQFWSAALPGGARRLTWQDFALNRDTNTPVSAQLDIYPSGDFIARSNLVESVYRRINPDDWDDDGYPNDEDLDPYAFNEGGFGPHQSLPVGANSNAYCWVDIVVANANALVTFVGDAPSALPDPSFIARAGETNRVTILIGKTYQVTCPMPIVCVEASDPAVCVDQVAANELSICWPVEIDCVGMRSGLSFSMNVWPDWLGGGFVWTNSCCSVSGEGWTFTYSCGGTCTCTGCGALGYYGYEGYRLSADGGPCGCGSESSGGDDGGEEDDDGPYDAGASVSFSKGAVIFEDRYENTPGVWVERQSTKTELHCVAHGGPNGGHVHFEIAGEEKLSHVSGISLPLECDIGPGKKIDFTIVYNGRQPSNSANDIIVTSTFAENVVGATQEVSTARMTSIKIIITPEVEAPGNDCIGRHTYGVCELVNCLQSPVTPALEWTVTGGQPISGTKWRLPMSAVSNPIVARRGDAEYLPRIATVEPAFLTAHACGWTTYAVSSNHAGGVGMYLELFVHPLSVSFSELKFEEVPCFRGSHGGYFNNFAFTNIWCHSEENGAGEWHDIDVVGNRVGGEDVVDTVSLPDELPRVTATGEFTSDISCSWSAGFIEWEIPCAWNIASGNSSPYREFATETRHRLELESEGTVMLRKLGNEVSRSIDGKIFLNGIRVDVQ